MANKEDCYTIEEAMDILKVSKTTLYGYINFLGAQRIKFPFDRKTYILKLEVDRIKEHIEKIKG